MIKNKSDKNVLNVLRWILLSFLLVTSAYSADVEKDTPTSVTTEDMDAPLTIFELKLGSMMSDELFVEADAWLKILQDAAKSVYNKKIEINMKNSVIQDKKDQNASDATLNVQEEVKGKLIIELTELRKVRKEKEDKLNAILGEINERVGLGENGKESDKVLPYRRYINSVSGVSKKITDVETFLTSLTTWLFSKEGGVLWLLNFLKFMSIIIVAYFIGKILGNGVNKAFAMSSNKSQLLNNFIVNLVKKLVMLLGLLMGLSILGVNMGPVLAFVGAAGFVVAFALQNTLSNFASGLMIMLYRPFDIDDVIDVSGVVGTVKSMTLVTTSIMTADNRMMIIPNNTIWGSIITNVTHSDKRRVDMTFAIGYSDNIDKVEKVLEDILSKHPLILKDPAPIVQVNELADSSVKFIVRPWTLTSDYWTVYWEITRRIKIRFDEEGITIPFPQKDIHIVSSVGQGESTQKREFTKKHAKEIDVRKMESGDEDDA